MSSAAGPSIATSGLVLDVDMSNTQKSWLGKPTTNYIIAKVENYTGWSGAGWWMHPGNTTSITSQILPDGNMGLVLNATTLSTGGLYGYNGYALGAAYVNGTQYTVSFWAKSFGGSASLNVRDADSGGTLSTGVSSITDTWKRFSFTWTANASTNMVTFTGSNFSLYNVQLEINAYATPFVNGTRSNTQAIVDLTGNNTLTANSLTYASDNTFSFNGTADRITLPTNISPTTITISAWVYRTSGTVNQGICRKNSAYAISLYNNTVQVAPGNNWTFYDTGLVIELNQWINLVWTYDGTTMRVYKNSVQGWSTTLSGLLPSTANSTYIGYDDNSWWWGGKISATQIYNRALSATEVQQNFNATRSRYGI